MRRLRPYVLSACLTATACTDGCWWTDPTNPEPLPTMRLGVAYPTEAAQFDVTFVEATSNGEPMPWPPTVEPFALTVRVQPHDADEAASAIAVERPATDDGDEAEVAPQATAQGDTWILEPLVLDVPGVWTLDLEVTGTSVADALALGVEVVE